MAMRLLTQQLNMFSRYKVPYNINYQEHKNYLKKVQRAQKILDQNQQEKIIPRRKRRIYSTQRIDRNITDYGAWRVFEQEQLIYKDNQHAMQVMKIMISPKWLIHAFGMGHLPICNKRSAHRQFYFEDNRLNRFALYQYRNTTDFKPNKQNYDYQNQQHLHPRMRISERISPQQFWKSQNQFQFRINYTQYAQKFKFQKWLLTQIQKRKSQKSYDQIIDEKFGSVLTFNKKQDFSSFIPQTPMVKNVTPQHFALPKKGKKAAQPQASKFKTASKMDQTYRIKQKITFKNTDGNTAQSQAN